MAKHFSTFLNIIHFTCCVKPQPTTVLSLITPTVHLSERLGGDMAPPRTQVSGISFF